jgi:hypothetical protein
MQKDYYVKLDNFCVEDIGLLGCKHMTASSGPELLQKAIAFYGFDETCGARLQLWSRSVLRTAGSASNSPHERVSATIRLDTMETIPDEYEFVWLRCVTLPLPAAPADA